MGRRGREGIGGDEEGVLHCLRRMDVLGRETAGAKPR